MSGRDRDELDREDLVARARRGLLSPGEHETLARALDADPALRAAYRVGLELDREGAVQGGDDALITRAADAAIARAAEMTSRTRAALASVEAREPDRVSVRAALKTRWAAAAAIGLSVIFASGIATALFTGAAPWPFERAAAPARESAPAAGVPRAKRRRQEPARAEAAPVAPVMVPAPLAPSSGIAPALRGGAMTVEDKIARKRSASPAERAAELFHEANNARRDGDSARARRLYGQLIAAHPSSDEAGPARVSLGRLLLAAGDARGAERELRRYLAAGGGQLSEEALVGQAQSLGQMGRAREERTAWQRLLAEHPNSVYAAQAEQRLAALARSGAESAR